MSKQHLKFADQYLAGCVLAGIVLICFGRSLGSYFLADDFSQISYAAGVLNGNLNGLLSIFTQNYLQCPVMKIYRPCLLLSLIFDYALWRTNAFGYFLTDILFMVGAAVMLYLLLRELTRPWENNRRSILFSLLSASLFASNPLHCESVSWVSGRDNVISAFFYLLSLWCFVRKGQDKNTKLLTVGIVSFWIAMLSKEMAIGLPIVLTGIAFFLPEVFNSGAVAASGFIQKAETYALRNRLYLAVKISMPIWLNTAVYLLVRFLVLGTLTGGYTGGAGSGLMSHLVERWTNVHTIRGIIYPLNLDVFGAVSGYRTMLSILYTAFATLILVRLFSGKWHARWLGLLVLWTLTTIAPLYQLWSLGDNLEGARFFFFLSIPLAIFVPLLILAPPDKSNISESASVATTNVEWHIIEALGAVAAIALVVLSTNIAYKNNIPWVHAGKQAKACLLAGQALAKSTVPGKTLVLLGIPKEGAGAHIIFNGPTFNSMMSKPFSGADYAETFITFDPLFFGADEYINAQRFKKVLSDPDVVGLFVWNDKTLTFDQLRRPSDDILGGAQAVAPITFEENHGLIASLIASGGITDNHHHQIMINDCGLLVAPSKLDPYKYDFIEFALKASLPKEPISVFWKETRSNSLDWCDSNHPVQKTCSDATSGGHVRIRLSDHWRWFTQENITRLRLEFLPGQSIEVKDMRLLSARGLVPAIAIANAQASNIGVYSIGKDGVLLDFDANAVEGCVAVKIEVSKPNYFFEGLPEEENKEAIMTTVIQPVRRGRLNITSNVFPSPGYYELRALCLDKKGKPIGERSDAITISI
jgi:hypothetical protein